MTGEESESEYDWTYYELRGESDAKSLLYNLIEKESLEDEIHQSILTVDLTDSSDPIEDILEISKNTTNSIQPERNIREDIKEICEEYKDAKCWFQRQDLETKIRIFEQYKEGELSGNSSVPKEVTDWIGKIIVILDSSNLQHSTQQKVLEDEAFESEVTSLTVVEYASRKQAHADLLTDPETIVLILDTGYIILEIVEKQYKYKPHKKLKERQLILNRN